MKVGAWDPDLKNIGLTSLGLILRHPELPECVIEKHTSVKKTPPWNILGSQFYDLSTAIASRHNFFINDVPLPRHSFIVMRNLCF